MNVDYANGQELVEHWTWAADKGVMNKNSAGSLRAACTQVLSVVDNWESINVEQLDVEDILHRFQNLRGKDFKPDTLNAYMRRFRQAVDSFLEYKQDPSNWKPTTRKRSMSSSNNVRRSNDQPDMKNSGQKEVKSVEVPVLEKGLVEYPYPLREDLVIRLRLPSDLTLIEAKRLSAFMTTLTVDFEPVKMFE